MNTEGKSRIGDSSASRKLGLSCAECRRSKLKCDRSFPCQSCIRRGCAGICPEGTLAATKGNKVLMAHAQRLSEQVESLKARVQELELSLAKGETNCIPRSIPAAAADLSDTDVTEAIGSLSIGVYGQSKYHGESASSEYFQGLLAGSDEEDSSSSTSGLGLPLEIVELMNAFPFGLKENPYHKSIFLEFLPSKQNAFDLVQLYYTNFSWMYDPIPYAEFNSTVFDPIYGSAGSPNLDEIHSHRISVFFMLLANGLLAEAQSSVKLSRHYHALGRAAIAMDPITSEATCATIQSLFLSYRYLYTLDRYGTEERWIVSGINARLAHTLGLQRDGSNWNLEPEEIQRRRRVFWELYMWEAWASLVNGRPAALSIQQTDCLFPDDLEPHIKPNGEVEPGWNSWKYRYASTCITACAELVFSPRSPSYAALLEVDKKVRTFQVPEHLQPTRDDKGSLVFSENGRLAVQQLAVIFIKETNLLYIHRSYFAQAIRQNPQHPLQHKYGQSVLVIYHCTRSIISALRKVYATHPLICSTAWYFWTSIFSACIVLGALVVESPSCRLSPEAFQELERTVPFYQEGAKHFAAPASIVALEKLLHRASLALRKVKDGHEENTRPISTTNIDDLEVLSGRRTVIPKLSRGSTSPKAPAATSVRPAQTDNQSPDLLMDLFKPTEHPSLHPRPPQQQQQQQEDFNMRNGYHHIPDMSYHLREDAYMTPTRVRQPYDITTIFGPETMGAALHAVDSSMASREAGHGPGRPTDLWRATYPNPGPVDSTTTLQQRLATTYESAAPAPYSNGVYEQQHCAAEHKFNGNAAADYNRYMAPPQPPQHDAWRNVMQDFGSN